jgi:hypothetical protein
MLSAMVALCLAWTSAGPAAGNQPEEIIPVVAGTTIIRADGVSGIKLNFPEDVRWYRGNIGLEMSSAVDKAFVGVRSHLPPTELCDLCFGGTFVSAAPRSALGTSTGGCSNANQVEIGCLIPAGVHEIYLASDGILTFTMRFAELNGVREVDATGDVQGEVVPIPASCHVPDCSLTSGWVARQIGLGGRAASAGVVAWVNTAAAAPANPSAVNLSACAYPGYFNDKTGEPGAHPFGCDIEDVDSDAPGGFLLPSVAPGDLRVAAQDGSGTTHGTQYLGFTAHSRAPFGPTKVAAYGHWFNEGISCPSGNFFYCPQR